MQITNDNSTGIETPKVETLWQGKFLEVLRSGRWEYVSRCNASAVVAIIAVTENNELILTEQFRPPLGKNVIDLAAGLVGDEKEFKGEGIGDAAIRELVEETGYAAESCRKVFDKPSSAGLTDELVTYVLAKNLKQVSSGGGVGNERIVRHVIPINEIDTWLDLNQRSGKLIDGKIDVALNFIRNNPLYAESTQPKVEEISLPYPTCLNGENFSANLLYFRGNVG